MSEVASDALDGPANAVRGRVGGHPVPGAVRRLPRERGLASPLVSIAEPPAFDTPAAMPHRPESVISELSPVHEVVDRPLNKGSIIVHKASRLGCPGARETG